MLVKKKGQEYPLVSFKLDTWDVGLTKESKGCIWEIYLPKKENISCEERCKLSK